MNFMVYDGWSFSYPQPLLASKPPELPVVYAVQVMNLTWKPLPYEPIFFGESENLARTGLVFHPAFGRWSAHPAIVDGERLYFSYLWLPRGAEFREHVERSLIARYRPICNFLPQAAARAPSIAARR